MFSVYPFPCDDWENKYTLSYCHHQIRSMNYYPLLRVRSWNNGVHCMSFYILMLYIYILSYCIWEKVCNSTMRMDIYYAWWIMLYFSVSGWYQQYNLCGTWWWIYDLQNFYLQQQAIVWSKYITQSRTSLQTAKTICGQGYVLTEKNITYTKVIYAYFRSLCLCNYVFKQTIKTIGFKGLFDWKTKGLFKRWWYS